MKSLELEFETNANGTGLQLFQQVEKGLTPSNKSIYIYKRVYTTGDQTGNIFGYEVVMPSIKKAGTYNLPPKGSGKTITYEEDFEEYPGASLFGKVAWFFPNFELAKSRFESLKLVKELKPKVVKVKKIRKTINRDGWFAPEGEFSVNEIAEKNNINYTLANQFVIQELKAGRIEKTRKERRNLRGKETQLYKKCS